MTIKHLTIIALTSILITTIFAQSQMASALDSTTIKISPVPPVIITGDSVTLTVTVTDSSNPGNLPTGSVTFTEQNPPGGASGTFSNNGICTLTGTSQCQITYTAQATVPNPPSTLIVASYGGDINDASSQVSMLLQITPPPSNTAQGSVTILGTCGVAVSPQSVDFGQTLPGGKPVLATNNPIVITNNGNTPASPVTVVGTDWISSSNAIGILAQETAFSLKVNEPPGPAYLQLAPVSNPPQSITITSSLIPGSPLDTYWQLTPITTSNQIVGQLTQTLTFSGGC